MQRKGYRFAVEWIALNDDAGSAEALNAEVLNGFLTVGLVADIFGVEQERVARDVVRYRKRTSLKR